MVHTDTNVFYDSDSDNMSKNRATFIELLLLTHHSKLKLILSWVLYRYRLTNMFLYI